MVPPQPFSRPYKDETIISILILDYVHIKNKMLKMRGYRMIFCIKKGMLRHPFFEYVIYFIALGRQSGQ